MPALPTGTVTFLFTDIEGSTRIWEREPERMRALLTRHDAIVRRVVEQHGGHVFKTVGDAFCVAFHDALEAADAAVETQRELLAEFTEFKVRAAIYTGPAVETDGDYFGPAVNRVARLLSAGHGGQILVDGASAELIGERHRSAAGLKLLGEHRLRDLSAQEKVFQVLHPELPESFPPLNTLDIAFRRGVVRTAAVAGAVVLALTGLALVALDQAARADRNAGLALEGERRAIRGEKSAVMNANKARFESERAAREERAAEAATRVARQERNRARDAAEKERLAKVGESIQKQIALVQKAEAGIQRDRALERLINFHIANGDRYLESGGPIAALPWYQRVLEITRQAGKPEENARIRLAAILRNCLELRQILPLESGTAIVRFSPDGNTAATLTNLQRLRLWDLRSGRAAGATVMLGRQSGDMAFSPDGRRLLTGLGSPILPLLSRRLEVRSARGDGAVELKASDPTEAVFSPDSRHVFAGSEQSFAALYDADKGEQVGLRLEHPGRVGSVAFFRGNQTVITGCDDGNLRIWRLRDGRLLKTLVSGGPPVDILRVTPIGIVAGGVGQPLLIWDGDGGPDQSSPVRQIGTKASSFDLPPAGDIVATCDYESRSARIWDVRNGNALTPPLLHPAGVMAASFSPDGALLATACDDGGARLWNARSGTLAMAPLKLASPCVLVQFSPSGSALATVDSNGTGRIWAARLPQAHCFSISRQGAMDAALFSSDGRRVITAGPGQSTVASETETGRQVAELRSGPQRWSRVTPSADGKLLITAGPKRTLRVWDAATLRPLSAQIEQQDPPTTGLSSEQEVPSSFAVTHDRRRLYVSSILLDAAEGDAAVVQRSGVERDVSAWELPSGRRLPFPVRWVDPLRMGEFSSDGRSVLLVGTDRTAGIFSLPDGTPRSALFRLSATPAQGVFSPDGRVLAIRFQQVVELWETHAGKRLAALWHRGDVFSTSFSRDGSRLVTASADGTARIWSTNSGLPLTPSLVHSGGWVVRASFSPNGNQVVTVSGLVADRGEARIWDAHTGEALTPPLEHPRAIRSAEFSADGKRLVTCGVGGFIRIWDLTPEIRPLEELASLSAVLSGLRFASDGTPETIQGPALNGLFQQRRTGSRQTLRKE